MWPMPPLAQPGTPVEIPFFVHVILWPLLLGWTVFLVRRRRARAWPCLPRFGASLVPGCLLVDAAALIAAFRWPTAESNSFVFALLWLAVLFSVTAYFALRTPGDGRGGDDEPREEPEPPWWPEFERDLRDYMRRRPRRPAGTPKTPAGVS
jgi:hypothetical protein